MRFNKFPLDEHVCKFLVGSSNYDDTRMVFETESLKFNPDEGNTVLDYAVSSFIMLSKITLLNKLFNYQVTIDPLKEKDTVFVYGDAGNYSITGFEMRLVRNIAK